MLGVNRLLIIMINSGVPIISKIIYRYFMFLSTSRIDKIVNEYVVPWFLERINRLLKILKL